MEKQSGQSDKGSWTKQDFILETLEKFPRTVCVTNWKDKVSLESLDEEDLVKVFINIESNEYKGKWYTDLKVWKMEKIYKAQTAVNQTYGTMDGVEQQDRDLPF